jgi:hypothetical protein
MNRHSPKFKRHTSTLFETFLLLFFLHATGVPGIHIDLEPFVLSLVVCESQIVFMIALIWENCVIAAATQQGASTIDKTRVSANGH